jgi:hypothetical protein
MKQKTLILLLMFLTGFAFAQTPPSQTQPAPAAPPAQATAPISSSQPLAEVLEWLSGKWEGQGVMAGDQEFVGTLEGSKELDDQAILLIRESMSKAGIAGGRKEIMVIGFEGSTKKIVMTLHTSGNFIGIYTGELKGNEIIFTLATAQQGYTNRRSFKLLPDGGLSFIIQGGAPGKAVGKLVEINFRKK